ncbi:MAG: hypothetical protein ACKO96_10100, partial [Flammeovirgaceae bacterium]
KNLFYFTYPSTNKMVYPIYWALYKSDTVNPVTYYDATMISVNARIGLPGANFDYLSNYVTLTSSQFLTYPGVVRF